MTLGTFTMTVDGWPEGVACPVCGVLVRPGDVHQHEGGDDRGVPNRPVTPVPRLPGYGAPGQ
jgi:hypothetical protein